MLSKLLLENYLQMKSKIVNQLKAIEKEKGIEILFAVEAGSRVWRIQSKDSDYDVRFVFKRPVKDYLSISKKPEVIERTVEDMDFVGFDIYKFTKLFLTSNPSMIEWLKSDIIYLDDNKTKEFLWKFIKNRFNPLALYHHYKSMCKQNYLKYLKSGKLRSYKKYLYAMRGLINAKWVQQYNEIPPIHFTHTLNASTDLISIPVWTNLKEIIKKQIKYIFLNPASRSFLKTKPK